MTEVAGWTLDEVSGVLVVRCAALSRIPGLAHAFSTRRADDDDGFDLGGADPPSGAILRRRDRFLAAAGFGTKEVAVLRQVHGNRIVRAERAFPPPEADGVIWTTNDSSGRVPSVRTADCVPILLASRDGRAAAAVHAGWRGTAAQVALRAVEALIEEGVSPSDLNAALGPSIRPCCYPVGHEVARAVANSISGGGLPDWAEEDGPFSLDLHDANRRQLVRAGVPEDRIHGTDLCTSCRPDLFFSYRREGSGAGRMMAAVGPGRP